MAKDQTWMDLPDFSEKEPDKPFEQLEYAQHEWADNKAIRYRVYSSASEFVEVEAANASAAISVSKIEEPFKVERILKENAPIVQQKELTDKKNAFVKPLLDSLTEDSPVISNKVLSGLMEASEEIKAEQEALEQKAENTNQGDNEKTE